MMKGIGRAEIFRSMRRRLGYTQARLAMALGVTQASVARWEGGTVPVDERAMKLGAFLVRELQSGVPKALDLDVDAIPREDLPAILGQLVELEARVRLRLVELQTAHPRPAPASIIGIDAAIAIAGTSRRWLLSRTKGLRFRHDLSRNKPRFDEAGLRAWLAGKRRV